MNNHAKTLANIRSLFAQHVPGGVALLHPQHPAHHSVTRGRTIYRMPLAPTVMELGTPALNAIRAGLEANGHTVHRLYTTPAHMFGKAGRARMVLVVELA